MARVWRAPATVALTCATRRQVRASTVGTTRLARSVTSVLPASSETSVAETSVRVRAHYEHRPENTIMYSCRHVAQWNLVGTTYTICMYERCVCLQIVTAPACLDRQVIATARQVRAGVYRTSSVRAATSVTSTPITTAPVPAVCRATVIPSVQCPRPVTW